MVKIWFNRLLTGQVTFSDIPAKYKDGVKALCRQYVSEGKMSEEHYKELIGEDYETE